MKDAMKREHELPAARTFQRGPTSAPLCARAPRSARQGHTIRVLYTTGNWLDVDTAEDVSAGARFQ